MFPWSRKHPKKVSFKIPDLSDMANDPYKRSNSVALDFQPDDLIIASVELFKDSMRIGKEELIQRSGQNMLNSLNKAFGIEDEVELVLRGKRPASRKIDPNTGRKRIVSSTHGKYYPDRSTIALYALTSTGRRVAYKTLFNTLIHEFCHHMDYKHPSLRLKRSLHTKGFYERLNSIYIPLRDI